MLDLWDFMFRHENGDDVETGDGVWLPVMGEPGKGGSGDLTLLEGGHGELRRAIGKVPPGLDLHEDDGVALPGHDVDLAGLAAIILLQDGEPPPPELRLGNPLPPLTDAQVSALLPITHS